MPAPAPRSSQAPLLALAQLRHVEQRERVAEERAHDLGAGAQRGDVAAPPGEHQVRVARQRRGLGLSRPNAAASSPIVATRS